MRENRGWIRRYLSEYILFALVILHVALQRSRLWKSFREKAILQAFLGVLAASGAVLPLPLLWGLLASRPHPMADPTVRRGRNLGDCGGAALAATPDGSGGERHETAGCLLGV